MAITVNTNLSSLICQRSLNMATKGMNTALERMSTGLRINSAKDDAAGMAISSKMNAKLSSYAVAQDNAQMGQSMIDTASGSLSVMNGMLQRMRDLAEQAANGTYGKDERAAMQAEVDALTEEIYRIKNTTEFNGKKILGEEEHTKYVKPDISINDIDVTNITQAEWDNTYKGCVIGISSADELQSLAILTKKLAGSDKLTNGTNETTFALTGDIDLSSIENWDTIGTYVIQSSDFSTCFQGTFNGNGYKISNLKTNKTTESYKGLFGATINATLENVKIENANVNGSFFVGILAGSCRKTNVNNIEVSGTCTAFGKDSWNESDAGGIVGHFSRGSIMRDCVSSATVDGKFACSGGLVGTLFTDNSIINSKSTGNVTSTTFAGGIVGQHSNNCIIENCSSIGIVSATSSSSGGLVGDISNSSIKNSYSTSKVQGGNIYQGSTIGTKRSSSTTDTASNTYYAENINGSGLKALGSASAGISTNYAGITGVSTETDIPSSVGPQGTIGTIRQTTSVSPNKVNLQVGINADSNSVITVDTAFSISGYNIDLSDEISARHSLTRIDKMLSAILDKSLELGATSNRLTSTMEFQSVQMSALTSASSLIKDADIAKESASYIKNQILQQTTATLLATANQNPSIALSLV